MRRPVLLKTMIPALLLILAGSSVAQLRRDENVNVDSTFRMLTLPELQNYRVYYVEELESLQREKRMLIQRGIDDGERLLEMQPDPTMVDQILIRLADLYYYQDKDRFFDALDVYDQHLAAGNTSVAEPKLDVSRSLAMYQRVIDEYPESALVDDATYNKAFLYEETGQYQRANQIYNYLVEAYPQSPFVPEAHMRLGEYYFNPPRNELNQAIGHYEKVIRYPGSPRYSEALYKLGWSYYRLSQYAEAISYFTTLVEDADLNKKQDEDGVSLQANLRDEAIEYIAISFHDYGGSSKALEYLNGIGRPKWGETALLVLGDVYRLQKEEYANAIAAYDAFLEYAPLSPRAPEVQKYIVDCHVAMDQHVEAIAQRRVLFDRYRRESDWWLAADDRQAQLRAYSLSEEAMRENVHSLIGQANERQDAALFERAVAWAGDYLEAFPENPYAYMIRWNRALILDTKLGRFKDALEEYLTISLVYNTVEYERFAREKGLATVQDAAENAIVAADSIYQAEQRINPATVPVQTTGERESTPLTSAENYLAMAYDNYIKLYPFDEKTPTILANAGALYYTHNQFNEALRFFRTLVKYFPESEQIQRVQYSILESYMGKKDYASAEILARRMAENASDPELKDNARKRWAESIFFKAQAAADSGAALESAREFYRVALEVPSIEFADRALFNAGQQFDKAGQLANAVRAYEALRLTYATSQLVPDAVNNLAYDYAQLGESAKAAQRYEISASLSADTAASRDALYNAQLYFEKAGEANRTAETALKYADAYPNSPEAPALVLKAALIKLSGENASEGAALCKTLARRYPASSIGVEALWKAGDYWERAGQTASAEADFDAALAHYDGLADTLRQGKEYFAADALFRASVIRQSRFAQMGLHQPESTLNDEVRLAAGIKDRLIRDFTRVAEFQTAHLPEVVFRLGQLEEQLGRIWAGQEMPLLSGAELAVKKKAVGDGAARFYNRAKNGYLQALAALDRLESALEPVESADSVAVLRRDSLTASLARWKSRSESKVSEMLFQMAEVQAAPIEDMLSAPLPADLTMVPAMEYRNQLIFRAVKPQADAAVSAHYRNIQLSDSIGAENIWADSSRSRMAELSHIVSDGYFHLSRDIVSGLRKASARYYNLAMTEMRQPEETVMTDMINLNELFKTYSRAALLLGQQGLAMLDSAGVSNQFTRGFCLRLAGQSHQLADSLQALLKIEDRRRVQADSLFQVDSSPFYEELLTVFEDNVFYLKDHLTQVLETAYSVLSPREESRGMANWLGVRLIYLDKKALERLDIHAETVTFDPDRNWQVKSAVDDGWQNSWSDDGWQAPQPGLNGEMVWSRQSVDEAAQTPSRLYIRRKFSIPGYIIDAELAEQSAAAEQCYINGVSIPDYTPGSPLNVGSSLKIGNNIVAFEGKRLDMNGFKASITVHVIPLSASERGGNIVE